MHPGDVQVLCIAERVHSPQSKAGLVGMKRFLGGKWLLWCCCSKTSNSFSSLRQVGTSADIFYSKLEARPRPFFCPLADALLQEATKLGIWVEVWIFGNRRLCFHKHLAAALQPGKWLVTVFGASADAGVIGRNIFRLAVRFLKW